MTNFKALEELVEANEKAPGFNLEHWEHDCGTYGCLFGNYLMMKGYCVRAASFTAASREFDISMRESMFLFLAFDQKWVWRRCNDYVSTQRPLEDRHAAINRVRKFIAVQEAQGGNLRGPQTSPPSGR